MLIYNNYLLLKQFFMVKFNALSSCKVSNELIAMQLIMPFLLPFFLITRCANFQQGANKTTRDYQMPTLSCLILIRFNTLTLSILF